MFDETASPSILLLGLAFGVVPLAGLAAALSGSLVLGAGTALVIVMAWRWPDILFWSVILIAPLSRSPHSGAVSPDVLVYLKAGLIFAVAAIVGLRYGLLGRSPSLPGFVTRFLLVWLAVVMLSVLHARDAGLSLRYLPLAAAGVATFILCSYFDEHQQTRLLWAVLSIGAAIGILVLLQYVVVTYGVASFLEHWIIEPRTEAYHAMNPMAAFGGRYRPSGTMLHPNSMGAYFAVLIPWACALAGMRQVSVRQRAVSWAVVIAMALGLFMTNSRGAAVALAASLLYLSVHAGYRWLMGLAVASLLGLGLVFALGNSDARLQALEKLTRVEYGLSGRPVIWRNVAQLIRQEPWLGVGPGNMSAQYVSHFGFFVPNGVEEQMSQIWSLQNLSERQVTDNYHAHNSYLQFAAEIGILGPLLLLWGLGVLVYQAERRARLWPLNSLPRALALAVGSLAVGVMIYGLFDSPYTFTKESLNLIAACLLAIGLQRSDPRFLQDSFE
jgi:O-antigen ligase